MFTALPFLAHSRGDFAVAVFSQRFQFEERVLIKQPPFDDLVFGRGGFALVAWPAEYGESGIMTFIVNQQGRVYQKNFGPKTAGTAEAMQAYDPDKTWSLSAE